MGGVDEADSGSDCLCDERHVLGCVREAIRAEPDSRHFGVSEGQLRQWVRVRQVCIRRFR
jgi:hypothetical protein